MKYNHSKVQAKEYTDAALAQMAEHGIPPEPMYFAIWYAYASGENPDLGTAIEAIKREGAAFTAARLDSLHQQFFGRDARGVALEEASHRIEVAVNKVMGTVGAARDGAARYGSTLQSYSGRLSKGLSLEEMANVVEGLAAETEKIVDQHQQMDAELARSAQEITKLRQDIQDIEQEAMTDPLTGIANRKRFETCLTEWAEKADDSGHPLSLLLIDIDFFKKFNDNYGHNIGDMVLRLVAGALVESIKGRDLAARYGGEEFAIVLPQTAVDDAVTVANHIRVAVGSKRIVVKSTGAQLGTVTLSIGVAEYQADETLTDFIDRTDKALYAAKRNGRNQVVATRSMAPKLAAGA